MSRIFELNKLIRGGILANMKLNGQEADYEILDTSQRQPALTDKVVEELKEFDKSGKPTELGDAYQAFREKVEAAGYTMEEIQHIQEEKFEKMGGFADLIFVHRVTLEDGDEWVPYYEADPDRFPEVKE